MRSVVIEIYSIDEKQPELNEVCWVLRSSTAQWESAAWIGDAFMVGLDRYSEVLVVRDVVEWTNQHHKLEEVPIKHLKTKEDELPTPNN